MPILESNYYAHWVGKQTAKGTPNTTPGKRLVTVGGQMTFARDDGSEDYSDLQKYGATTDWVNSLTGSGEPAAEATPTELAYLLWLFHGAETVTAVTGPPAARKHSFEPASGLGHYFTLYERVGNSVVTRHRYDDCLITKVVLEGSTANKAVRITPTILSLDPGKAFTSDPAATLPTDRPFLYTDGAGAFTLDGDVYPGQTTFTLTIDDAWSPIYGDDVTAFDLQQGKPTVAISATMFFDADVAAMWNTKVYGTATPTNGQAPLKTIPDLGSYAFGLTHTDAAGDPTGRALDLDIPGVKWTLPDAPGGNPAGGVTEVTMAGAMRPTDPTYAVAPYTIDVSTDDAVVAFTT